MATSMFAKARKRLRRAAKHLEIDPDVLEKLKYPQETLAASLMVRRNSTFPVTSCTNGRRALCLA
jgi:hypothetical protein